MREITTSIQDSLSMTIELVIRWEVNGKEHSRKEVSTMTTNQLKWAEIKESIRHNQAMERLGESELTIKSDSNNINRDHYSRADEAAFINAAAATRNAENNALQAIAASRQADASVMNAQSNARNAETNYRNALTNQRNAATNEFNASVNRVNAQSSRIQADAAVSRNEIAQKQYELDLWLYPVMQDVRSSEVRVNESQAEANKARAAYDEARTGTVWVDSIGNVIGNTGRVISSVPKRGK
nr:hypothetical protein [Picobirnavirus sp.]